MQDSSNKSSDLFFNALRLRTMARKSGVKTKKSSFIMVFVRARKIYCCWQVFANVGREILISAVISNVAQYGQLES